MIIPNWQRRLEFLDYQNSNLTIQGTEKLNYKSNFPLESKICSIKTLKKIYACGYREVWDWIWRWIETSSTIGKFRLSEFWCKKKRTNDFPTEHYWISFKLLFEALSEKRVCSYRDFWDWEWIWNKIVSTFGFFGQSEHSGKDQNEFIFL